MDPTLEEWDPSELMLPYVDTYVGLFSIFDANEQWVDPGREKWGSSELVRMVCFSRS